MHVDGGEEKKENRQQQLRWLEYLANFLSGKSHSNMENPIANERSV